MKRQEVDEFRRRNGVYPSRYWAKKDARGDEVVVKVCGGYIIMDASQYLTWKNQK